MKLFNALLGTLTAGLLAATLTLTTASWIDGPKGPNVTDAQVASADAAVVAQNG